MATVPLRQVIAEMVDAADQSEHVFRQWYRIGVRGCRKFNMDIYGSFKTVLLNVSANHTVAFPEDYLTYSTIGIVNGAGEAVPLTHNPELVTLKSQYIEQQKAIVEVPTTGDFLGTGNLTQLPFYWLNFGFNGTGYIHLYGIGGGTGEIGQFTIDEDAKCFFLAPGYPYDSVLLEYLSDGFETNGNDYRVNVFAVEALQAYVRWQRALDNRKKYPLSEVAYLKNEFNIQKRDARFRINKSTVSEMQVTFRRHVKLVARA